MFDIVNYIFNTTIGNVFSQFGIGFCMRIFLVGIFMTLLKSDKLPVLHPAIGVLTVIHYFYAQDFYSEFQFVTPTIVIGFVSFELVKLVNMVLGRSKRRVL
jgi:hypothetical protein